MACNVTWLSARQAPALALLQCLSWQVPVEDSRMPMIFFLRSFTQKYRHADAFQVHARYIKILDIILCIFSYFYVHIYKYKYKKMNDYMRLIYARMPYICTKQTRAVEAS